jgi:hypothetical protein
MTKRGARGVHAIHVVQSWFEELKRLVPAK